MSIIHAVGHWLSSVGSWSWLVLVGCSWWLSSVGGWSWLVLVGCSWWLLVIVVGHSHLSIVQCWSTDIWMSLKSCKMSDSKVLRSWWARGQKDKSRFWHISTRGQQFHKQFCGASTGSVSVSKQAWSNVKQAIVRSWGVGEPKGKEMTIEFNIYLQWVNRFVNGFVERFQSVNLHLNEPKIKQNEPW